MKVKFASIDFLTEMIYATGITSSPMISFFNQYGLNKPQVSMLESKRHFARECLAELNGSPQLKECIIDLLQPSFEFYQLGSREQVLKKLNRVLKYDGYEIIDDGFEVEIVSLVKSASQTHLSAIDARAKLLNHESLQAEIRRIERAVEEDPSLAIGSAKEMLESVCKAILERYGETELSGDNVPRLVKRTCKKLRLLPEDVPDQSRGADKIRLVLSNLGSIAQHIAELRNLYGSGHGKAGSRRGLRPRHARLVVGASSTLALFLLETFEETEKLG